MRSFKLLKGVLEGSVLGALFFIVLIDPIIHCMNDEKTCYVLAYIDDLLLRITDKNIVMTKLKELNNQINKIGLTINYLKCN